MCVCHCVCVFEVLTHQWFINTAKLLEVLKVSLSLCVCVCVTVCVCHCVCVYKPVLSEKARKGRERGEGE